MSPLKRKKLNKIRTELDKLDNSLIKGIKKKTNLLQKVLELKDKKEPTQKPSHKPKKKTQKKKKKKKKNKKTKKQKTKKQKRRKPQKPIFFYGRFLVIWAVSYLI